jgi:acid phosphatase
VPLFGDEVDLVLTGHNHTYERWTGTNGLTYVTTGGGGAGLYPSIPERCKGPGKVAFTRTVHHAVRLTATPESLTLEGIGLDGKAFDTVSIEPRR